jgi:hypothetical protein
VKKSKMADHTLNDLWTKVESLELKCAAMATDLSWIKLLLLMTILIGLGAIGIQVPHYIP